MSILSSLSAAAASIRYENSKTGSTGWQLTNPATNREIEGYASLTSVNAGSQISFYVSTSASTYTLEIFRMGWYGGVGARSYRKVTGLFGRLQAVPAATSEGLMECQWSSSYDLSVPGDWVTGIYLVKLTTSNGKQSYIIFVVRDDLGFSDFLFQSSVTTFQAYNNWPGLNAGGKSLYDFNSSGNLAAYKVSFNRPYAMGMLPGSANGVGAGDFLTMGGLERQVAGWEYNMVRWIEKEGYDVSYCTNIDTHNSSFNPLLYHKAFLSVGHDEYWSWQMRANVEAARDRGVDLGFFGANICYWQIRLEPSLSGNKPNRTIVGYKWAWQLDPYARDGIASNDGQITYLWRFNAAKPSEQVFIGAQYISNSYDTDIVISNRTHWTLAGSGLLDGSRLPGLLGYEVDAMFAGNAPYGTTVIAHSPIAPNNNDTNAYPYSDMTVYTTGSGSTVFAAGSIQWSWGLDAYDATGHRGSRVSEPAQTITRNVLDRFLNRNAPNPPSAPSSLRATASSTGQINLTWADNSWTEEGIQVYRSSPGAPYVRIASLSAGSTSYSDRGLVSGLSYSYKVDAYNDGGTSAFSNEATATLLANQPPTAPTGLRVFSTTSSSVLIYWNSSTDDNKVAGYRVFRNGSAVGTMPYPFFFEGGLRSNTTYTYTVQAYDGAGNTSALSSPLLVTTDRY
jgi:chitodextrinase